MVEFDAAGRVVRLAHLAGEADRSVATEFWAGVLILLPGGGAEVGADDGTWTLPLDPDRETLCELVRRRVAGQPIRLSAPVTDAGTLHGVVGTLCRAQETTDAPLHEVIGWWAADLWGAACVANGTQEAGTVTEEVAGVPMCGAAARLVLLSGLDYGRMRLTPQSELRLLV